MNLTVVEALWYTSITLGVSAILIGMAYVLANLAVAKPKLGFTLSGVVLVTITFVYFLLV